MFQENSGLKTGIWQKVKQLFFQLNNLGTAPCNFNKSVILAHKTFN